MAISYPSMMKPVEYPSSDGLPMAESDFQRYYLTYSVEALRSHFQDRPDVYVSGNLFIYYEEGNPQAVVAPDVFVVIGTEKRDRSSYFLWQEPKGPDFVLEITSRATRSQDQGAKRGTYAFLGVREYILYDPTGDYLKPSLQGFRLEGDNYEPLPGASPRPGTLVVQSSVLGLELRLDNGELRFYDPATGKKLLSYDESISARQAEAEARQAAEALARNEAQARHAAEARLAELEARLREQGG